MEQGYTILRKIDTGEILRIASRNSLQEARQLVRSLRECWPGRYLIRKGTGRAAVCPPRSRADDRPPPADDGAPELRDGRSLPPFVN